MKFLHHIFFAKSVKLALLLTLIGMSVAVNADDIEASIQDGLAAYKNGNYSEAAQSLNYAAQLIQQKKGESLQALLPKPLSGWQMKASQSQAAGAAMFGGGVTAEAKYLKGDGSVNVSIITDSPMLQSVMMMFSNPMFATSSGGKLEKIAGQRAIVRMEPDRNRGEIQIVVDNRILVTVSGNYVSAADLKAYVAAINFAKLKSS